MIPLKKFGRTGHQSSRTIFGAFALSSVTQKEADETLEILKEYGINHIDTASSYDDSELRIGPWMKDNRKDFFLATKTEKRTYQEAKDELHRSLDRLKVDHIDLWQMHMLVNPDQWNTAMHSGGVIDAFKEAKKQGLTRFLGVTGHGLAAPKMHLKSLDVYDFDTVLLPYNYILMQNAEYAANYEKLVERCKRDNIAIQTIKSIARGIRNDNSASHNVWYDPLDKQEAIDNAVNWVLGNEDVFLNTVGDIHLLRKVLKATDNYHSRPTDSIMNDMLKEHGITSLFNSDEI